MQLQSKWLCTTLQMFTGYPSVFPAISMEEGCKNHRESLYSPAIGKDFVCCGETLQYLQIAGKTFPSNCPYNGMHRSGIYPFLSIVFNPPDKEKLLNCVHQSEQPITIVNLTTALCTRLEPNGRDITQRLIFFS